MRCYTNIEYALAYLASVMIGGKKSIADFAAIGKELVKKPIMVSNIEQAKAACLVKDTIDGIAKIALPIDTHVSFLLMQGAATRCETTLSNIGAINHEELLDTHTYLQAELREQFPDVPELPRKEFKKIPMQWGYNGEFKCLQTYGWRGQVAFREMYKKHFPNAEAFRIAIREAWDDQATNYKWILPDGFQAMTVIENGYEEYLFGFNGASFSCYIKKNAPIKQKTSYGFAPGTLCMAANATHGLDGFAQRELARMADMTRAQALDILAKCKVGKESRTGLEEIAKKTSYYSTEWFYILREHPQQITAEVHNALANLTQWLPTKRFDILAVHDEFACTVNHLNDMRVMFNYIVATIYKSNWGKYIGKALHADFPIGEFKEDVYRKLINSEYLLRL